MCHAADASAELLQGGEGAMDALRAARRGRGLRDDVKTVHGAADVDKKGLQAVTGVNVVGAGAVSLAITEQMFGREHIVKKTTGSKPELSSFVSSTGDRP